MIYVFDDDDDASVGIAGTVRSEDWLCVVCCAVVRKKCAMLGNEHDGSGVGSIGEMGNEDGDILKS